MLLPTANFSVKGNVNIRILPDRHTAKSDDYELKSQMFHSLIDLCMTLSWAVFSFKSPEVFKFR